MTFEVARPDSFPSDEAAEAKRHWASIGVREFYGKPKPWAVSIADRVLQHRPSKVFEFGCNVGRNLMTIKAAAPDVHVVGVDINADAVGAAAAHGLDVRVGDESAMASIRDAEMDVSFTVSVLDHIPDPAPALRELTRISRTAVLLLEPWVGTQGKVLRNPSHVRPGEVVDTTPYSYSWDYPALASRVVPGWTLTSSPHPLGRTNLGAHYVLYQLVPALTTG